ncbi:MAG: hypothetical protein HY291_12845 [Planctomycetes bacterium]|nr:hypothetical protein [Planctomycetota bacterium]
MAAPKPQRRPIGEILVSQGLATEDDIAKALELQKEGDPRPLGQIILALTEVGSDDVVRVLAKQFDMECVDLDKIDFDASAVGLVSRDFAWENIILPYRYEGGFLKVAIFDPLYLDPLQKIAESTGLKVKPVLSTIEALDRALQRVYRGSPMQPSPLRPPLLWERKQDLRRLIGLFLKDFSSTSGRIMKISRMALGALLAYRWTSVRELMEMMEIASKRAPNDVIRMEHLPSKIRGTQTTADEGKT